MKNTETALLVMDMQNAILARLEDATDVIANTATAIAKARHAGIPVFYVVVGFRPDTPEVTSRNKMFSGLSSMAEWTPEFAAKFVEIHPDVAPKENEAIITKRRVSAFTGSDLEVLLRANGIEHLVLTGVATSGVVLSTLREAADKDFKLTVIADCCADRDAEVHRVLTQKVFPVQAEVLTVNEWEN